MLTSTRVKGGLSIVALAVLLWLPGEAGAQFVYPQQRFDPNAINAMLAAQQAASAGRAPASGRFRYIASVTGSGVMTQPLQTVNQFGPNAYSQMLNVNPFSGASGIAGGAAVGIALAAQANLIHEPAGVQVNAMYNSPINQRSGINLNQSNFGSPYPSLGTAPYGGFGMNPYGGIGANPYGGFGGSPYSRGY